MTTYITPINVDASELLPVVRYIIALNTEIDRLRAENDRLVARCGDTGVLDDDIDWDAATDARLDQGGWR